MFQEFPKAVYLDGSPDAECAIVQDAEQEAAKREQGFRMVGEAAADTDDAGDDLDALRAEAEAKGVKVDARWGAKRLRKEIEAA